MKFKKCRIHPEEGKRFEVELNKKITVLLGRNGDGKTTMLRAIEQELEDSEFKVVNDDAANRGDDMYNVFDPVHIVSTRFSSEGETLVHTLGIMLGKVGTHIHRGNKVVLCLDKMDSGLSVDRIKEAADFLKDTVAKDVELMIVTANSYELASQFRDVADFFWVKEQKFIELPNSYEEYIKLYFAEEK